MNRVRVWRDGQVRVLKQGVAFSTYKAKFPDAIKATKAPTIKTLEGWLFKGVVKAVDGCKVEPDGTCPHGCPSWAMYLGIV